MWGRLRGRLLSLVVTEFGRLSPKVSEKIPTNFSY